MAAGQQSGSCSYELDTRLTITLVGPGWNEFAIENGATELVSPAPLGLPLMMFFSDATTVHLYEELFFRVARWKRPVTFPIRCDAPAIRRFLDLTIAPKTTGGYSISTTLVRSEVRAPIALLTRDAAHHADTLTMCGWCKRVEVNRQWVDVESAISSLRLFERSTQPRVAHGICQKCHHRMATVLEDAPKRR